MLADAERACTAAAWMECFGAWFELVRLILYSDQVGRRRANARQRVGSHRLGCPPDQASIFAHIREEGVVLVNKHALCNETILSNPKCCLKNRITYNYLQSLTITYNHLQPVTTSYKSLTSIYESVIVKAKLIKYKYIGNHL